MTRTGTCSRCKEVGAWILRDRADRFWCPNCAEVELTFAREEPYWFEYGRGRWLRVALGPWGYYWIVRPFWRIGDLLFRVTGGRAIWLYGKIWAGWNGARGWPKR